MIARARIAVDADVDTTRRHSTSILGLEQIGGSNAERKSTAIGSRNGFPNSAAGPFPAEEG